MADSPSIPSLNTPITSATATTTSPSLPAPTPSPSFLDLPALRRLRDPNDSDRGERDDWESVSVAVNPSDAGDDESLGGKGRPEPPIIPPSPIAPTSRNFGAMSGQWKPENIERWRETAVSGEGSERPSTPIGRAGEVGGEDIPPPTPSVREGSIDWGRGNERMEVDD